MNVKLVSYTPYPDRLVYNAMRACAGKDLEIEVHPMGFPVPQVQAYLINQALDSKHMSVLEHINFTFYIEGISRVCSHQLVRHRHASYSQRSARKQHDVKYVIPDSVKNEEVGLFAYVQEKEANSIYEHMVEHGVPAEDARYYRLGGEETSLLMTVNGSSLYNIAEVRMCTHAQWEIRALVTQMVDLVKKVAPISMSRLGPTCEYQGYCREGSRSCGNQPTLETLVAYYNNDQEV